MRQLDRLIRIAGGTRNVFLAAGGLALMGVLLGIPGALESSLSILDRFRAPDPIEITETADPLNGAPTETDAYRIPMDGPYFIPPVFSSDDRLFAAANRDWSVSVFFSRTGEVAQRLIGHEGTVRSVDFSSDGTRIATGSEDGTARVWNLSTGQMERVIFDGPVVTRTASPDTVLVAFVGDNMLAVGGRADTVQILNLENGEVLEVLTVPDIQIPELTETSRSLAVSPTRVAETRERQAALDQQREGRATAHQPIEAISVAPDGGTLSLVAHRATGDLFVFDLLSGSLLQSYNLRGELRLEPRGVLLGSSSDFVFVSGSRLVGAAEQRRFAEVYRISQERPNQPVRVAAQGIAYGADVSRFELDLQRSAILLAYGQAVLLADPTSVAQEEIRTNLFCGQRFANFAALDQLFLVTSYCQGGYGLLFERLEI